MPGLHLNVAGEDVASKIGDEPWLVDGNSEFLVRTVISSNGWDQVAKGDYSARRLNDLEVWMQRSSEFGVEAVLCDLTPQPPSDEVVEFG